MFPARTMIRGQIIKMELFHDPIYKKKSVGIIATSCCKPGVHKLFPVVPLATRLKTVADWVANDCSSYSHRAIGSPMMGVSVIVEICSGRTVLSLRNLSSCRHESGHASSINCVVLQINSGLGHLIYSSHNIKVHRLIFFLSSLFFLAYVSTRIVS